MAFLLLISRRPDVVFNAQFWAEDGAYWFKEAYVNGWYSLLAPHTGYFQTISRLTAILSQGVPIVWAPLFFNLVAIGVRLLVVWCLLLPRLLTGLANWWRVVAVIVYVGLPNTAEVFGNLTNAHWHLALLAFLIAWSRPTLNWQRWLEAFLYFLMGLSGPFVLIIAPLVLWHWYSQKEIKIRYTSVVALVGTFVAQLSSVLLTSSGQRIDMELGASVWQFSKIIMGQIVVAGIVGEKGYSLLWRHGLFTSLFGQAVWFSTLVVSAVAAVTAMRRGPVILRSGLIAAAALLAASLASPMASTTLPQWSVMVLPGAAGRYWFIPVLAFVGMMLWWLNSGSEKWRLILKIMFGLVLSLGIVWNWRLTPWPKTNFVEQAREFSGAKPGSVNTFNLNPANWSMSLEKK